MKSIKRAFRLLSALALVLACGTCLPAFAAADEPLPDLHKRGSVTLTLYSDGAVTDGALTLYGVAGLTLDDGNMVYSYTDDFAGCEAPLEDVTAPSLAAALAQYAEGSGAAGMQTGTVDASGEVSFRDLPLGLYLIVQTTRSEGYYTVDPFLVTVPMAGSDGWIYDVDASPKVEIWPAAADPGTPDAAEPGTPDGSDPIGPGTSEAADPAGPGLTAKTPGTSAPAASASRRLPQTGQLSWPVPVLAVCGLLLIYTGFRLSRAGRGRRSERNPE